MAQAHAYHVPQRVASDQLWRGKKLLVDFDGTLADCRKVDENSGKYYVERVRPGAREGLAGINGKQGRCFITSAGSDCYVNEMAAKARVLDVFERIFDCDALNVWALRVGDKLEATAKDYGAVMAYSGETQPVHNCAIIGNDPGLDVPRNPKGIVTVLGNMDSDMGGILKYLDMLLYIGGGSFAAGFDRISGRGTMAAGDIMVSMVDEKRWSFRGAGTGPARVVLYGMDRINVQFHMPI